MARLNVAFSVFFFLLSTYLGDAFFCFFVMFLLFLASRDVVSLLASSNLDFHAIHARFASVDRGCYAWSGYALAFFSTRLGYFPATPRVRTDRLVGC